MVKHTQTIRRQQALNCLSAINCLSVVDHFWRLRLKGLKLYGNFNPSSVATGNIVQNTILGIPFPV